MIRVTIERPSAALAAQWDGLAPIATNAFMHPAALKAASDTLLAVITVLLAWDTAVEPNKLVGWWALQGKHLLFWSYFDTLPFNYAFLSTPIIAPGMAPEVMPAFLAAVASQKDLPNTLHLRDFDGDGPAADALGAMNLPRTLFDAGERPVATRDAGIKRTGSTRKKLRQDWNRLAATGALEVENVRDHASVGAALDVFLEMEAAGWKGNRGTALLNDPAFLQYIGDRQVRSLADASDYIARGPQAMYAAHGFGLYLVTVRATGEKAGMCGILKRDALEDPDVGFAFLPAFRGHGYAREALDAVLSLAIDVHGLTRLAAIVDPANARSVGLLERAGFRTERRITMPDETTELLLMGMDL